MMMVENKIMNNKINNNKYEIYKNNKRDWTIILLKLIQFLNNYLKMQRSCNMRKSVIIYGLFQIITK